MTQIDILSFCLAMIEDEDDKKRFEELYYKYKNRMYSKAFNIIEDSQYAEDAVNMALYQIAAHIDKVEGLETARTEHFVMTIVQRVSFNILKKHKREKQYQIHFDDLENMGHEAMEAREANENLKEFLAGTMLKLLSPYKEVLLLKYADGYDNREIAAILDLTISNVNKIVTRGKKKLEKIIREEWTP